MKNLNRISRSLWLCLSVTWSSFCRWTFLGFKYLWKKHIDIFYLCNIARLIDKIIIFLFSVYVWCRWQRHSTTWQCFMGREENIRKQSRCVKELWRSERRWEHRHRCISFSSSFLFYNHKFKAYYKQLYFFFLCFVATLWNESNMTSPTDPNI